MELYYGFDIEGDVIRLNEEESLHCVRVMRHHAGDAVCIADGRGTLYRCRLERADPRTALARVVSSEQGFGAHPYCLTMGVCPTKNSDRFEWFVEKAVEFGVDRIVPIVAEHSERTHLRLDRLRRLALSASKQSLKALLPEISEPERISDFISSCETPLKLICCCFEPEGGRKNIKEILEGSSKGAPVSILIGPEGDFSPEELSLAIGSGWTPTNLGGSRLRTETAALAALAAVYFRNL